MKDNNWELIAKHLAKETNSEENELVINLKQNDAEFSKEYSTAEEMLSAISYSKTKFDKERIYKLIEKKINKNEYRLKLNKAVRYAAIIIATLLILGGLFIDLTHTKTITSNNGNLKTYILPDGSIVHLHQGAEIQISDSKILDFNRKVHIIKGEAYFEITKINGKGFIVVTPDYNINVLGTKFDVNCNKEKTDVVLTEGKILLNKFDKKTIGDIVLEPGDMISYDKSLNKANYKQVNPNIYSLWMEDKMEFKQFSISELAKVFRIYFNKTVIIKDEEIAKKRIGGSAPSDDFDLILKGLSNVLHRKIIHQNDTIIIE